MKSEQFYCKCCSGFFDEPRYYEEKHGLDNPPYESVAVCSKCGGDNFVKFNLMIEKTEVVERILPAIMHLNKYTNALRDVFGVKISNDDFDDGLSIIVETICEMFDFFDNDIQKQIFGMCSERELQTVLLMLKGEL